MHIYVMSTVGELYALQEIDLALDRSLARLAEIEPELSESEELLEARQVVSDRDSVVTQLRSRQQELEWSVEEVQTKASEVEAKLYGGTVRNPKELADLDTDLKSLRSQVLKREDALLALLVELEDADSGLRDAEAALREVSDDWGARQDQLRREKAVIEPGVERLQLRRGSESARIDRASLNLYDTLRKRRSGQAVARVERGMCQGCRITLPMSVLQKVRTGIDLVQCVSCERMLLLG